MSSTPAKKISLIEVEAEKQVYKEMAKSANKTTTKEVIAIFALLGMGSFVTYLVSKYTNIKVDSVIFLLTVILFFVALLYGKYAFKKRKDHHLKILRKGYDTNQNSQSTYSSEQSKSLQRKAKKEVLLSLFKVEGEDRFAAEESMKKMEESLQKNEDKMTVWSWMMIVPACVGILFSFLDAYMGTKIFELSGNVPTNVSVLSALAIMFSFGLLMSTVTNAQKGRVRPFRRRYFYQKQWVEKATNPKTFFCILGVRLVFAFAASISSVYIFLSGVF